MSMLGSGKRIGIKFTYSDGSTFHSGSWVVPHDSALDFKMCEDFGWTILYEIAKQPNKTVASVAVILWPPNEEQS